MYGRLAWYRIASSESVTAIAIPVRAVVADDADEGRHRQQEIGPLPGVVAAQLAEVDETEDRGDDDGGQDRGRQIAEERCQDDGRGQDQTGRDQRRDLGPVAGRLAGRGLAEAGIDREAAEQSAATLEEPSAISSWSGSMS